MKIYIPVFSITLLLSAILLFSVQPMFSKMILPLLGGTPQVWNTAMLFFQASLFCGYGYAHITSRFLRPQIQAAIHVMLLLVFTIILPIAIPEGWTHTVEHDPALWQLCVMAVAVGGPFFVVSGSAPMLQHWFASTTHKDANNPYFLYGASNLGSMAALISYPVIIEPLFSLGEQSNLWMYGYFALIVLTGACAVLISKNAKANKDAQGSIKESIEPLKASQRLKWIILSAIPSSLMLGVTTYITTDIASVPLLWIAPFALYVLTFIIVFARKQIFSESFIMTLSALAVTGLMIQMIAFKDLAPLALVLMHMIVFFIVILGCHYSLAQSKPQSAHLTEFYFFMSFGGVLGGFFNAMIAPNFFIIPVEYVLALGAAMLMRYSNQSLKTTQFSLTFLLAAIGLPILFYSGFFFIGKEFLAARILCACLAGFMLLSFINSRWKFGIIAALSVIISPLALPFSILNTDPDILRDRNFFGVHRINQTKTERILVSGVTNHGTQLLAPEYQKTPISYYSEHSPLHDVIEFLDQGSQPQEIAGLGLGVGVIACYPHEGRHFTFYEIDKDIADIAQNPKYFTYLSGCGSSYEIVIGDGRLEVEKEPDQKFDAVIVDVFSSDNIPVHIMTAEAIQTYMKKLKPNGILVMHVSNNYLDLEPVISQIGKKLDIPVYAKIENTAYEIGDSGVESAPAHYIVLTHSDKVIDYLKDKNWTQGMFNDGIEAWTDRYSNIISVLRSDSIVQKRSVILNEQRKKQEVVE